MNSFFYIYIDHVLIEEACIHRHLGTTNPNNTINTINIIDKYSKSRHYNLETSQGTEPIKRFINLFLTNYE